MADKLFSAKNGEIKLTHELIKEPAKFDNWYLVYTERYNEEAESLEDVIFEASKTFGIKFS